MLGNVQFLRYNLYNNSFAAVWPTGTHFCFRKKSASFTLALEQKGELLRQHGLHSEHLSLWEQELTTKMDNNLSLFYTHSYI